VPVDCIDALSRAEVDRQIQGDTKWFVRIAAEALISEKRKNDEPKTT